MNTELYQKLTQFVEVNLSNENFGPEDLADKIGMSHSTLHRKLKENSNQTISQFIREMRLKKAKEILLNEEITISEIAYNVGFGSATYFNKCFHDYFGVAPGEFRKKEHESKTELSGGKKQIQKVLLFVVIPVIIFAFVFLILNQRYSLFKDKPLEKSLAILPVNYIGEPKFKYQAEGTWEEIKDNLANIKDLTVLDRSSVEKYHSSNKSGKQIGKELNVSILLKITFQLEAESIVISINLLKSEDGTILFAEKYPSTVEERFLIPNKIAESIASVLNAEITSAEKLRIEKIPTINLTAHDFYQQGKAEYWKYQVNNENKRALEDSKKLYNKALNYDSTFALAYAGLAQIYWDENYWDEFFKETFLDSVKLLSEKALSFDNQLAEAHNLKGLYFASAGNFDEAMKQYDLALKINSNLWEAYFNKGKIYLFNAEEIDKAIFNLSFAAKLHRGGFLPQIFNYIALSYNWIGLTEESNIYHQEAFKLNGDSLMLYSQWADTERLDGNYNKSAEWYLKAFQYDSTVLDNLVMLGFVLSEAKQYEESLKYYQKLWDILDSLKIRNLNSIHRIGYAYLQNGNTKKANYFFNLQKQYCEDQIKLNRINVKYRYVYYDLAAVYAVRNEKNKAIENLRMFNERQTMPYWAVSLIKEDPLLNSIRNEHEFQQIVLDIESKYLKERERVKKWLEENEIL